MKFFLAKIRSVAIFSIFLAACHGVNVNQVLDQPEIRGTSTNLPSFTKTVIMPGQSKQPSFTPTLTPLFTLSSPDMQFINPWDQATAQAFRPLCINAERVNGVSTSPDGKWIAAECYRENGEEASPLQVVNFDHSKDWKTYFREYDRRNSGSDRHDLVIPYRWSKDGKFLYAVTPTRLSGCCWIGGQYILLVRLNLETGEQKALLNASDPGRDLPVTFTLTDNDRYLLFTPPTPQNYDLVVQDVETWDIRTVSLAYPGDIDLTYAVMSPDHNAIVMPLFRPREFNDFRVASIVMIDLAVGDQTLLISDLKQGNELYPIHFEDTVHVLFSSTKPGDASSQSLQEFWLYNTQSETLQKVENR